MTKNISPRSSKRTLWIAAGIIVLSVAAAGCAGSGNKGTLNGGNNAQHQNNARGGDASNDSGAGNGGGNAAADPDSGNSGGQAGSGNEGNAGGSGAGNNGSGSAHNSGQTGSSGQAGQNGGQAGEAVKKGQGLYIGQVDTHSVEIDTDQGATVFQIDDGVSDQINALDENTTVAYEYTEKVIDTGSEKITQLWLTSIQAVKKA